MKTSELRILIASDNDADAKQIASMLKNQFERVSTSSREERFVSDFDAASPDVLILAFQNLESSEQYCLGLFRHSEIAHAHPHRSIVLCTKDNVRRAFELCRKEYFDDYVLFWPLVHDSFRLPMSIIIAGRSLLTANASSVSHSVLAQAGVAGTLETTLDERLDAGRRHIKGLDQQCSAIAAELSALETHFDLDLESDGATPSREDAPDARLRAKPTEGVRRELDRSREQVLPLTEWFDSVKRELSPQLDAVRTIGKLAAERVPVVLVVDDDEFQCKLLASLLESLRCQTHLAHSGGDAFAVIARHRPDLILMDIELPDTDGITVARRIRSIPALARTPIIMITGHSERRIIQASLGAGASDFVVKPFERRILLEKLARFIPMPAEG